MVQAQVRCKSVEEANSKLDAERRQQEGELQGLRQQVAALREAGRAAQDWQGQVEMLVRSGVAILAPLGSSGGAPRPL